MRNTLFLLCEYPPKNTKKCSKFGKAAPITALNANNCNHDVHARLTFRIILSQHLWTAKPGCALDLAAQVSVWIICCRFWISYGIQYILAYLSLATNERSYLEAKTESHTVQETWSHCLVTYFITLYQIWLVVNKQHNCTDYLWLPKHPPYHMS